MLLVLNHKMNFELEAVKQYAAQADDLRFTDHEVVICPSYPYLTLFKSQRYQVGSQNVSSYDDGAHTGEVSAAQLKSLGVTYSLVGHSERRKEEREDSLFLREKIKRLVEKEMIPILCVGESMEARALKRTELVVLKQITEATRNLDKHYLEPLIIAYEPIWAIGSGLLPSRDEVEEVITLIKDYFKKEKEVEVKVLYGGSINLQNYATFMNISKLDGLLIGGLSLSIEQVKQLLEKK